MRPETLRVLKDTTCVDLIESFTEKVKRVSSEYAGIHNEPERLCPVPKKPEPIKMGWTETLLALPIIGAIIKFYSL